VTAHGQEEDTENLMAETNVERLSTRVFTDLTMGAEIQNDVLLGRGRTSPR